MNQEAAWTCAAPIILPSVSLEQLANFMAQSLARAPGRLVDMENLCLCRGWKGHRRGKRGGQFKDKENSA